MTAVTPDTNIYIAGLLYRGDSSRVLVAGRDGMIRVDASDTILNEVIGVLRDKFGCEGYRLHFAKIELLKSVNLVTPR